MGGSKGAKGRRMTEHATDASLTHYLHVIRRSWWVVVLAVLLASLGAAYASHRQEKLFKSSADVFLSNQNLAASLSNVQLPNVDPTREAATQADLAQTPAVAARALALAHVRNRTPEQLLSHSSVSSASDADILTFSVTDRSPGRAERLAQAYATAYTQYRRHLDTAAIARALNPIETRLTQMKASGQQASGAYASLLDKEQQLSTLELLQGSNAQLVRAASPAVQTQPRTVRNAAVAAALGLLLGIGLAFLRDALNTRVRSAGEVEERLELPLLARVPEPARRMRGKSQLVMLNDPASPAAEPYRILATNLDFVNMERSARTIMFTSAQRDEGKSTTVANLAVALARAGRRVILVDLDLRAPSLSGFFFLDDRSGLTDVVLGRLKLADALAPVPLVQASSPESHASRNGTIKGVLEVLPVGTLPPNPAEFAGSHLLAQLLSELERRADVVLIDAAPLLNLSDAMTLSSRVDALVVVSRLSLVRRPVLQELHRVLAAAPVTKLGVVLTGTETSASYGYGGYGHAYGPEPTAPAGGARERVT